MKSLTNPNDTARPVARERFKGWLEALATFEQAPATIVNDLRNKIATQCFDLVVAGQFKRGKTSVINALLGMELLPVGVVPLTSAITIISYDDATSASVVFESGERLDIAIDDLSTYATERGNPKNAKAVAEVHVSCPATWLRSGIRLIDTPGIGSIYRHNTDITYGFLPKADAALLVLSVEQPLSAEEREFLKSVSGHAGKIFFLLNKVDLLNDAELSDSLHFTRQALADVVGAQVSLFAVSARRALRQCRAETEPPTGDSGFPEFLRALDSFLQRDRGTVLDDSITRQLLRLTAHTRTNLELEFKALTTPLDELQEKIERFEIKKREVKLARDDSALLMGKEAVRLWMERVDEELASFCAALRRRVDATIENVIASNAALSTRQLSRQLEQATIAEIRTGYDTWRGECNRRLAQEFTAWCTRHAREIDDSVEELFRFSSELFEIGYDTVRVDSTWKVKSGFYYKFWSEPPSMRQLANALVLALPRWIGRSLLRTRFIDFAHESIETQSGRTRYDLLQRLESSVRDFRHELMERIDSAIGGIEAAIRKGTNLREAGTVASAERLALLRTRLESIAQIESEIREYRAQNEEPAESTP